MNPSHQSDGVSARLKVLRDRLKLSLRIALALRKVPAHPPASAEALDWLVGLQIAPWLQRPALPEAVAQQRLRALNQRSISAFVFSIRGGRVTLWPKPEFTFTPETEALHSNELRAFLKRARMYLAFLEATVRRTRFAGVLDFAFDVSDMPEDADDLPIFSFQKKQGAQNPLLPDVDFFHSKWYLSERDALRYEDKSVSACFVGSSTGAWLSEDSIRQHATPRLQAAAHFHGHPRVTFTIANAVHCLTEDARQLLMRQPYFGPQVRWEQQLRHRFVISMDGNGAACSRLVKGLHSNSVVIKFDSPYQLYYFAAMRPGVDHLLARSEQDVERFIEAEAASPGNFKAVTEAGQRFAGSHLAIGSVMDYTVRLLSAFAQRAQRAQH